jgi:hypothetical protein
MLDAPEMLETYDILSAPEMLRAPETLQTYEIPGAPDIAGAPKFTFAQALDEGEILILLISTIYTGLDENTGR